MVDQSTLEPDKKDGDSDSTKMQIQRLKKSPSMMAANGLQSIFNSLAKSQLDLSHFSLIAHPHILDVGLALANEAERHKRMINALSNSFGSQPTFTLELNRFIANSFAGIDSANSAISRLLDDNAKWAGVMKGLAIHNDWNKLLGTINLAASITDGMFESATSLHLQKISTISAFTEVLVAANQLAMPNISQTAADIVNRSFGTNLVDFSTTYADFYKDFSDSKSILKLPPILTSAPATEMFNEVYTYSTLNPPDEDEGSDHNFEEVSHEINQGISDQLENLLHSLNSGFISMLRGAREAFRSTNPDRIRHTLVSLRELVTHVLHLLASDDEVQAWDSSPEYYHNGKPTRKARVLYICREINHPPLSNFMSVNVKAVIECIDVFQRVHEIAPSLSPVQLNALMLRTEGHLTFLIKTATFH